MQTLYPSAQVGGKHGRIKKEPPSTLCRWGHHKRGQGNTSIDMTLGIVGISEMQKCGLKYVIPPH